MPEIAASMLNPREFEEEVANLGGSTRWNGLAVLRRLRIPMRFRVGERPAGAVKGVELLNLVFNRGAGERAGRIGRRGVVLALSVARSVGEGGAFAKKKLLGF